MTPPRRLHRFGLGLLLALASAHPAGATDWPQLQRDAARSGRSPDEVTPPYRARWLWFGEAGTLRHRLSRPGAAGWTHDLTAGPGKTYPLPRQVSFTLAGTLQPIVHRGRVFVASQEGKVFAIREDDGATVWEAELPRGSLATGAATGAVVAFASVPGAVHAYHRGQRTIVLGRKLRRHRHRVRRRTQTMNAPPGSPRRPPQCGTQQARTAPRLPRTASRPVSADRRGASACGARLRCLLFGFALAWTLPRAAGAGPLDVDR